MHLNKEEGRRRRRRRPDTVRCNHTYAQSMGMENAIQHSNL
jgi:hypothetical protein